MTVSFTQFLFPNGQQKKIKIPLDDETEDKARDLKEAGFLFEIENFEDVIWATIIDHDSDDGPKSCDKMFVNSMDNYHHIKSLISESWERFIWANL